jgi:hypothetical protein
MTTQNREQSQGESGVRIIHVEWATKIGLYEAIVLGQIDYWVQRSKHQFFGRRWVYNTYEGWQAQLPFMSLRTVRRAIAELECMGILEYRWLGPTPMNRTKWYTINYTRLKEVVWEQS